jgi:predicted PurR-regulated permease PerM
MINEPPDPRPAPVWARLHLWQMQPVRDILLGLAVFGLIVAAQKVSVVTVPLLLAILLAYLFEPVIVWAMRRLRMSRRAAVTSIIAGCVALVIIPAVVGVSVGVAQLAAFGTRTIENIQAIEEAQDADSPEEADAVLKKYAALRGEERFSPVWRWVYGQVTLEKNEHAPARDALAGVIEFVDDNREQVAATFASVGIDTVTIVLGWIGAALGLGFLAFLTMFFFFFTATEWIKLKRFGSKLLPDRNRDRIIDLLYKFDRVISGFIRGRLTIAFLQAVVFSIGYFLIGVPGAFLLGPAVAVLSIVPYLALVGLPVSMGLLALAGHTGMRGAWWWILVAPTAIYFLGQALDDYIWTPLIQGKSTGMDTPTILFASLAGGALFGVFGLLIAIPIAACLKILMQEVFWPRFQEWAEGRAGDPLPID